jgi:hypothetical protein
MFFCCALVSFAAGSFFLATRVREGRERMASRWDRDRKVDGSGGRDRDQDSRNGRGGGSGRTFESSHQRSKSPPREKRMIKLGGSSNTSASTSNNGQARAENNRSRSRSRDRSNGNGNSNGIRGGDRRRSESPKREGGIQKPSSRCTASLGVTLSSIFSLPSEYPSSTCRPSFLMFFPLPALPLSSPVLRSLTEGFVSVPNGRSRPFIKATIINHDHHYLINPTATHVLPALPAAQ